jgi:hypothetical protein
MTSKGARILRLVVDSLVAELIARKIDIIKIDPFVSSHRVPENFACCPHWLSPRSN